MSKEQEKYVEPQIRFGRVVKNMREVTQEDLDLIGCFFKTKPMVDKIKHKGSDMFGWRVYEFEDGTYEIAYVYPRNGRGFLVDTDGKVYELWMR